MIILIADDSTDDFQLLEMGLREAGFPGHVRRVATGDDALTALMDPSEALGLVVLDHYLPRKNSVEILEALRESPASQSCPVVVLTSHVTAAVAGQLTLLGASRIVEKPGDLEGYSHLSRVLLGLLDGPSASR